MILVMTLLMVLIVAGSTAGALAHQLFNGFPLSGYVTVIIGIALSLVAGFLLFASIYAAFSNVKMRFRLANVCRGALVASVMFTVISFIWPIYASFAHFSRYGAILFPILILAVWISLFSTVLLFGAEIVAIGAIGESNRVGQPLGPELTETIPQHRVLGGTNQKTRRAT